MIVLNIPWLCYSPLSASTVVAASITRDRKRTFDTRKIQPRKGDMFVRRSGQISNSLFFSLSLSLFFFFLRRIFIILSKYIHYFSNNVPINPLLLQRTSFILIISHSQKYKSIESDIVTGVKLEQH